MYVYIVPDLIGGVVRTYQERPIKPAGACTCLHWLVRVMPHSAIIDSYQQDYLQSKGNYFTK